ncbi:MAG: hypothetical protein MN733_12025 [Nitrososphaera sp.]|nr:hypothetical protein [Nitrososphaera sp.]
MMKSEVMTQQREWLRFKVAFWLRWPAGHIERIENLLSAGIPDVTWCAGGKEGWIEIKTGYQKPTPLQRDWISRRRAAGGNVKVLTVRGTKSGRKALIELNSGEIVTVAPIDWARIVTLITD